MLLGLVVVGVVVNVDKVVIIFAHEVAIVHASHRVAVAHIISRLLLDVILPIGDDATVIDSAVLGHVLQLGRG